MNEIYTLNNASLYTNNRNIKFFLQFYHENCWCRTWGIREIFSVYGYWFLEHSVMRVNWVWPSLIFFSWLCQCGWKLRGGRRNLRTWLYHLHVRGDPHLLHAPLRWHSRWLFAGRTIYNNLLWKRWNMLR